jgi:hypothetical protein
MSGFDRRGEEHRTEQVRTFPKCFSDSGTDQLTAFIDGT